MKYYWMRQIVNKNRNGTVDAGIVLWCPGCKQLHQVREGAKPNFWQIDYPEVGGQESPNLTIHGSILVHHGPHLREVCHSFVQDGQWKFLDDSTHELAGKTVDLVLLPDYMQPRTDVIPGPCPESRTPDGEHCSCWGTADLPCCYCGAEGSAGEN